MDKRRTKVFRDKLLDRREGLVGQVQAAELYSRERDAEATQDPADMAANAYTKELLVSMSDNDRQLLNLIDEALERIETAGYGKCVHCGEALSEKRLDAVPWARHCVRCQDLQERGLLGQSGGGARAVKHGRAPAEPRQVLRQLGRALGRDVADGREVPGYQEDVTGHAIRMKKACLPSREVDHLIAVGRARIM